MSRYVLLVLLCSTSAGCAGFKSCCNDYCDHWCEKDPVQAALIRNYKQETCDLLCPPFMPLEVMQGTRPYLVPGISDLSVVNLANAPMTTTRIAPVPAAGPAAGPESTPDVPPPPVPGLEAPLADK
jgi:hypothetical protein